MRSNTHGSVVPLLHLGVLHHSVFPLHRVPDRPYFLFYLLCLHFDLYTRSIATGYTPGTSLFSSARRPPLVQRPLTVGAYELGFLLINSFLRCVQLFRFQERLDAINYYSPRGVAGVYDSDCRPRPSGGVRVAEVADAVATQARNEMGSSCPLTSIDYAPLSSSTRVRSGSTRPVSHADPHRADFLVDRSRGRASAHIVPVARVIPVALFDKSVRQVG